MRQRASIKCSRGIMMAGRSFSMNTGAYCAIMNGGKLVIGDDVTINRNTMIVCHERISIGSGCSIAPNVLIYDHDHKFGLGGIKTGFNTSPVIIGNNCWIGGGCIILKGTHIGEGCVIGAGCVLCGDIPANSLVTANRDLNIRPLIDNKIEGGINEI